MSVESLKNAINRAVTAAGGSISFDAANAILKSHRVKGGYMTVVVDREMGIENDYFVDLIHDGKAVTGINIKQDVGQYL